MNLVHAVVHVIFCHILMQFDLKDNFHLTLINILKGYIPRSNGPYLRKATILNSEFFWYVISQKYTRKSHIVPQNLLFVNFKTIQKSTISINTSSVYVWQWKYSYDVIWFRYQRQCNSFVDFFICSNFEPNFLLNGIYSNMWH